MARLTSANGKIWVSILDCPVILSLPIVSNPVVKIKQRIPMAEDHLAKVKELFHLYDSDADNSLSLNELLNLLIEIGKRITALPATAQVAAQQGKYLGKKFHKLARVSSSANSMS